MKEVLFISYYFPPMGGAGTQRSAKFVKYLRENNWRPIVLTARPEDYHLHREFQPDESLLGDVAYAEVHRVRDPEPRGLRRLLERLHVFRLVWFLFYGLFWEKEFFWALAALPAALRIARARRPAAVYTTSGPYSTVAVGYLVKLATGLPWVADLRDLWTQDSLWSWPSRLHYALTVRAERVLLGCADTVIANTPLARERLRTLLRHSGARVVSIANGFDGEDLPKRTASGPRDILTIAHVGTFHDRADEQARSGRLRAWLRGTACSPAPLDARLRTPALLFEGLRLAFERRPELRGGIRIVLVGHLQEGWRRMIADMGLDEAVEITGYLPHHEAMRRLAEADALFCVQVGFADGRPAPYVPAKVYEYMATGKPILAPLAEGDTKDVLRESGLGLFADPHDSEDMARILMDMVRRHRAVGISVTANDDFIRTFERSALSRRLAAVLDSRVRRGTQ